MKWERTFRRLAKCCKRNIPHPQLVEDTLFIWGNVFSCTSLRDTFSWKPHLLLMSPRSFCRALYIPRTWASKWYVKRAEFIRRRALLFIENVTRFSPWNDRRCLEHRERPGARFIAYITLALSLRPRKDKQLSNFTDKLFVYTENWRKWNP